MKLIAATLAFAALAPAAGAHCIVTHKPFGTMASGQTVEAWTIDSGKMKVTVLSLGGIMYDVEVPDRHGQRLNVIRNLKDLAAIEARDNFSSLIGRYANRISGGGFDLDGTHFALPGGGAKGVISHGGPKSFGARVWTVNTFGEAGLFSERCGVELTLVSPDGDNGFPGELTTRVEYSLRGHTLTLDYRATTTKPTVLNLTHHAYWNLSGAATLEGQTLSVNAGTYLPAKDNIPTGEILPVEGRFDLRKPVTFGAATKGLDQTFMIDGTGQGKQGLRAAAVLSDPASGRRLTIKTTQPTLVVYPASSFDGSLIDGQGRPLVAGSGVALETQHATDAPHHPNFASTVLRPGETFHEVTTFDFTTR